MRRQGALIPVPLAHSRTYPGNATPAFRLHRGMRWELTPVDAGTQLTLLHTVEDREWVPKVAAGWHLCLDVAEHLMDGDPIGPIRGEDAVNYGWTELNAAYADKLSIPNTGLPG